LDTYSKTLDQAYGNPKDPAGNNIIKNLSSSMDNIIGIREYDVPYITRVAIDYDIRVGLWYNVKYDPDSSNQLIITPSDKVNRPDPVVMAFDIETTKLPLKFPDSSFDQITMISYMVDGAGFLITNRDIISEHIDDFEYTPARGYEGFFTIFNEVNEKALINRFFSEIRKLKPNIISTYNGDFFDWPFIESRARVYGMDLFTEIGFKKDENDEYKSSYCVHMDCLCWVKRDSYLPAGSHGLKAVTKYKLGYNPQEIDPEDMTRCAIEEPQRLARYSVSDSVATYYLYMKYVHTFTFSLCNIIPTIPDEVLRKGSGTLCEYLLMVQSYKANVIMPNKHSESHGKLYEGHLLESETYVGGHVEALQAGVFRNDIPTHFQVQSSGINELLSQLDNALKFSIEVEGRLSINDIANYDEVKQQIAQQLQGLVSNSIINVNPLIYHLDVAAMYPNIILTNRLQPDAMVTEEDCASCDFNIDGKSCDRRMTWSWRGEYYPATQGEVNMIKNQLNSEKFTSKEGHRIPFNQLPISEQSSLTKSRLSSYSRKVYKKVKETKVEEKTSIVCQRENPFYINTVRNFRDRRYQYKALNKKAKKDLDKAIQNGDPLEIEQSKKMVVIYDSLQLAHKCILNSFYGYVMRKGARWFSMEMGGIVCLTGAKIIQMARQLVEKIGRPLELDTDGIWCILPESFPQDFTFNLKNGGSFSISYPCTMLNHLVHDKFTNDQYQDLEDPVKRTYTQRSENSIFFEVDGPYRAMILPASKEEDKLLKKRYAVFNMDGSLAELKGFEVKRRGELKIIKAFQTDIFKQFLEGSTLVECYQHVALVADQWLDILYTKGSQVRDHEIFELISEDRNMSKALQEYGSQKSTSITTAQRLAEFLGDQMVKEKGLACKFIISAQPTGVPVSERAIPIAIFSADDNVKHHFIRRWTKQSDLDDFDIRSIIDWDYYIERFGSVVQKLITIPAAWQKVPNPVPRIKHPEWAQKKINMQDDTVHQRKITDLFAPAPKKQDQNRLNYNNTMTDVEDFGSIRGTSSTLGQITKPVARVTRVNKKALESTKVDDVDLPTPDINGSYSEWLKIQKIKWKQNRLKRQADEQISGPKSSKQVKTTVSRLKVPSYFQASMPYLTHEFQILQISPADVFGNYMMWIYVKGRLFNLQVELPRLIYLNSRISNLDSPNMLPKELVKLEKCEKILPRLYSSQNLYEMTLSETVFIKHKSLFTNLFCHQDMEGVYQSQLDPLQLAVLQLGSMATLNSQSSTDEPNKKPKYQLNQFKPQEMSPNTLDQNLKNINYIYLFHAQDQKRHIIGVFSTMFKDATIVISDHPNPIRQLPDLDKMYEKIYSTYQDSFPNQSIEHQYFNLFPQLDFQLEYTNNDSDAFMKVQKKLSQFDALKMGPSMVIMNSTNLPLLKKKINGLSRFPTLEGSTYTSVQEFPTLDWQRHCARRMFSHLFNVDRWLSEQVGWANYANLPLCNLSSQISSSVMDIQFARILSKNQNILWWSPSPKPDLGGRELDEYRYIVDNDLSIPSINSPGSYNTVCFEIKVSNLCVNTLLNMSFINDLEGINLDDGFIHNSATQNEDEGENAGIQLQTVHTSSNNGNMFSDGSISNHLLNQLKALVRNWLSEAQQYSSPHAEQLIDQFYHWVTNKDSHMYDPLLHRLINELIRKTFAILITEIKKANTQVVYADFQKVVVATTKLSLNNGYSYSNYLLKLIHAKPLFQNLQLSVSKCWDQLIWLNVDNFTGMKLTTRNFDGLQAVCQEDFANPEFKVEVNFKMGLYLPPVLQPYLDMTLARYLDGLHKHRLSLHAANLQPQHITKSDLEFGQTMVEALMPKITGLVTDLQHKWLQASHNDPITQFTSLPDTPFNEKSKPVLEFVKCLFGILELDSRFEDAFRRAKADVLDILNVREFSKEAMLVVPGEEPQSSYYQTPLKIPPLKCTYCSYEWHINPLSSPLIKKSTDTCWKCPSCQANHPRENLELVIIESLQNFLTGFTLQDLSCAKCQLPKEGSMEALCIKCAKKFTHVQYPTSNFKSFLQNLLKFSKYYEFEMLTEVIESIVNLS
jgi:DNA polymerase epsilon subunit 1